MKSLQLRLALWLGASLLVVFGGLALMLHDYPRYLTEEYIQTRLQHDADSLRHRLRLDGANRLRLSRGPIAPIYTIPDSGHYYTVKSSRSTVKSASLGGSELNIDWDSADVPGTQRSEDTLGNPLLVWVADVPVRGQWVRMAIAEDVTHLDQHLSSLKYQYLLGIGLTLMIILALQALLIRFSLRPFEEVRRSLHKLGRGEIQRITTKVPSEVQPLIDEINWLGEVMQKQMTRSRTAIGNLAHAIKTPVSAIQQALAVSESEEMKDEIQDQIDRVKTSIERELRRARLSGAGMPGQYFEADKELPLLIEVLKKIYADKDLSIEFSCQSGQPLVFDRADMMELIGNLLDNACKWAKSAVVIKLQSDESFEIRVEDDGPGIDAGRLEQIKDRGVRLDESTSGHGLGLAIVDEIVEDHHGSLEFDKSTKLGGLQVLVTLPLGRAGN